jgi:hypothetical protein
MKINKKSHCSAFSLKVYSWIEDSEVVLVFERNNAGFRNCEVLSEQTSDPSAFLLPCVF